MTKNRSWMGKVRKVLLGVGVALAVGLVPSTAQAVTGGSASDLTNGGGDLQGNQVYFGYHEPEVPNLPGGSPGETDPTPAIGRLDWHVVDKNDNDLTLWSGETHMGYRQYHSTSSHMNWSDSDICKWLNSSEENKFLEEFTSAERNVLKNYGTIESTNGHDNIDISQKVVLPSVEEVKNDGDWKLTSSNRQIWYWLRSPGFAVSSAAYVDTSGDVNPLGSLVDYSILVVRPALKIPLDSILFTSSASGSGAKSEVNVGDGLQAVDPVAEDARTTTPLKLSVIDSGVATPTVSNLITSGNQVSFDYANGVAEADQYLSVLITDKNDNDTVVYYGKLAATEDAGNGNVSFDTSKVADGDYTIKIFNEKDNGEKKTDVASEPVEYDLYKRGELPYVVGSTIAFDGYEWYVIGGDNSSALRVLLKSVADKNEEPNDLAYVGTTAFDSSSPYSNHYDGSDLKSAMEDSYDSIENEREKGVIQGRTLKVDGYKPSPPPYSTGIEGDTAVTDAKFWPLSTAEAVAIGANTSGAGSPIAQYDVNSVVGNAFGYWLRSPGNLDNRAAYVNHDGNVNPNGDFVRSDNRVVRPAFDLPLDSLLFTSSASGTSGGKAEGNWVAGNNLYTAGEAKKFAMKSAALQLNGASVKVESNDLENQTIDSHTELTIDYTGATVTSPEPDTNHYVKNTLSAILYDSNQNIVAYQQLKNIASGGDSGIELKLPANTADGDYTLALFNEEINQDLYTNFASAVTTIPFKVENTVPKVLSVTPKVIDTPVSTREIELTFDIPMNTEKGQVKLVPEGSGAAITLDKNHVAWSPNNSIANSKATYTLPAGTNLAYNTTYKYELSGFEGPSGGKLNTVTLDETFTTVGKEATPTISIASYTGEKLSGFENGFKYTINDNLVTPATDGSLSIDPAWIGTTIEIVKKGLYDQTDGDSEIQELELNQAETPTSLTPTSTIAGQSDGSISGVTTGMQYHTGDKNWTDCPSGEMTGLAAGTYFIRLKSKDDPNGHFYSTDVKITVAEEPIMTTIGESVAYDGYEWYIIGNGRGGIYPNSGRLTLFLKTRENKNGVTRALPYVGRTAFDSTGRLSNHYKESTLVRAMGDSFGQIENDRERNIVKGRELEGNSENYPNDNTTFPTGIAGDPVGEDEAKFWPLSTSEAFDIGGTLGGGLSSDAVASYGAPYWLRSPGGTNTQAAFVYADGMVGAYGNNVSTVSNQNPTVRPAFDMNLDSLLFVSSASDSSAKIKGSGDGSLGEWKELDSLLTDEALPKYTMLDEELELTVTDKNEIFYADKDDKLVTINYTGATISSSETASNYLSAFVTIDGKEHYLKAAKIEAAEGKATFKLPDSYTEGDYKIKVFNEEINEKGTNYKYTDFAGSPTEIAVKVVDQAEVTVADPGGATPLVTIDPALFTLTFDNELKTNEVGTIKLIQSDDATKNFTLTDVEVKSVGGKGIVTAKLSSGETLAYGKTYKYEISGFVGSNGMGTKQVDEKFNFTTMAIEDTPDIAIDFTNERLTNFLDQSYTITGDNISRDDIDGSGTDFYLELNENMLNQTIEIVKDGIAEESYDSKAQELKIPKRPDAPDEAGFTLTPEVPSTDTKGTIEGITANMQYRVNAQADEAWTDGTGVVLENLVAGDKVEVRYKAIDGTDGKFASQPIVLTMNYQEAQPSYIKIDYTANDGLGALKEMIDNANYEFVAGEGTNWTTLPADIDSDWYGKTLSIVHKGTAGTSTDSEVYKLAIPARLGKPTEIKMTPASAAGGTDGTLTGVTTAMEYQLNGGAWTTYQDGQLQDLKQGDTVNVRYRADNALEQFVGTEAATFTMTARPVVNQVSPTENLAKSSELTIEFTKDLAEVGTITLENKADAQDKIEIAKADISIDGADKNKVTATYSGLTAGKMYKVIFNTGFKDTDGNTLDGEADANTKFEVTAAKAPTVTDTAPTNGAANVAISLNQIKVTFSEAVDRNIAGSVILESSEGPVTLSQPTWNGEDTEATYTIESGLGYSTTYTYQISGFTNAKGFKMADNTDRTFTTIAQAAQPNVAINYNDEKLTGFDPEATYEIKIDTAVVEADYTGKTEFSITDESWFGQDISIIRKGDGSTTDSSKPQKFTIPPRHAAPDVTVTPETRKGVNDGEMTVVSPATSVEFKRESGDWEDYTAPITGLTDGTKIDFRTKHTEDNPGAFASGNFRSLAVDRTMVSRPSATINTPMTNAPVSGTFVLEFDQDMDTNVSGTVTLEGIGTGQPLTGQWTSKRTYTVSYSDLTAGQVYDLTINGFKAESPTTLEMAEDTRWTLTIAGKPTVTTVTPSGSTNVPIDTTEVTIAFSVPMETLGTVILTDEDNNTITATSGRWTDGPNNKTAVYEIAGLKHGKTYTYTINGFVSQKGTKLDENKNYSFTTIGKEESPVLTVDYVNEQLTGFDKDAKYQIVGEEGVLEVIESLDISGRITDTPTELEIVKLGTGGEKVDSEPAKIPLPERPSAPSGLAVKPASSDIANDGEITGVNATMEFSLDGGTTWKAVKEDADTITGLAKGDKVIVRQFASDEDKRFRGESSEELTVSDRPTVVSVETMDKVPNDGTLTITFNRPMDEDVPGTVMLGSDTLDATTGKWNDDRTVYTIEYKDLVDSKTYQITISDFTDQENGNVMADNTDFIITVGDHAAPKVTTVTPEGAAVSITTDKLVVNFDETVKAGPGTVTAEGLTIENPVFNGTTVTYDLSGLKRNETYNVKVSGFTDIAGNEMVGEHLHEFSTEKSTYTVAFDKGAEDATGTMRSQTLTFGGDAIELPGNTFQRTSYRFTGWLGSDGKDYTDKQSVKDLTEEHEAKIILTAQWAANSYKARFDANQGTGTIAEQTFEYGGSCVLPTEGCTREGYQLVGWSTSPIATPETTYGLGATIPWNFTVDTTFYAVWQQEFTLRFNPDNGEAITEQTVLAGDKAIEPPAPVKEYHSFGGWLFEGSLYNFDLPVSGDMELTAQWNKIYHTVTFNANGGSGSTNRTVMSGTSVAEPEVVYYGHRLIGWSTSPNGGALWDFAEPVTDDLTLYAQWEAIPKYTLTFEVNGGEEIFAVPGFEDTVIDLNNYHPIRPGYIFDGWYSDAGLTVSVTQITLTGNQTVYAKWQEVPDPDRYTLSFNTNGGSAIDTTIHDEDEVVDISGFRPTKEGYTFAGWYDNAGLSGNPITSVTMTQNQVVYAKWTAESYQVALDLDGGTGDTNPLAATFGEDFAFPTADGYEKVGHQLIGWQIGDTRFEVGAVMRPWTYTSDQIMTAIWVKDTYAIEFDSRGGTGVATQYIEHGERVIEPSDPTLKDHIFTGWYLTKDLSGDPVDFETYTATEPATFFAGWEATTFYEVSFQSRDGHKPKTVRVRQGEKAPVPESWEWEGYTFAGWVSDKGEPIDRALISGTTTFEAQWTPIEYMVTLVNLFEEKDEEISYDRDHLKPLPVPERRGYTFGGWREVSRTREVGQIHHDMTELFGNCVLEAVWTANQYNVIFDTAGGNNLAPISFTVEDAVNDLPTPTRDGYIFQGWFDADGKEVTSITKDTIGDQPLTARWLVDKTKLEALVADEAKKNRAANSYTDNSWKVYETALIQAQTILDKEDATPQEVAEALAGLEAAIKQLTEKGAIVQPTTPPSGTTKQPSSGGTTNQIIRQTTRTVNQPTGQSSNKTSLLQTGEKETALYLILGLALVGLVIPAWKKNRDATK
ncbi:InlB B-repeat-containing protein [Enterococcus sp. 669A]|uniref:InlB B-repeat-containing protein n=1 Tax=Candidatus Enterococcus moelleringii TaxID=2815325 RepID=A0ABS3LD94_9ENTE|nr:InlB B-repeat-containing protein [Enterococcus sp. 669A]MBO1307008.1 InlB B-repeat-containing protein [Enterococcus sp. 669A]